MEMTHLVLFAWALALVGALGAAMVVHALDGLYRHGADVVRRLRDGD